MIHIFKFIKSFNNNDMSALAAETAFYLVLSVFPLAFLLISVASQVNILSEPDIVSYLLPESIMDIINTINIESNETSNSTIISALGILWTASNSIYAIMKGVHKAYTGERLKFTIRSRAIAVIFTVVFVFTVIISFGIIVMWNQISAFLAYQLNFSSVILGFLRYVIAGASIFGFMLAIYFFTPESRIKLRYVMFGAGFASVSWLLSSRLYQFYIENFSNYSSIYGPIGTFMGLVLWLLIISFIILIGAEINALFISDRSR